MTRLLLGLTTLPYYGPHPGTVPLLLMVLLGFMESARGGMVMLSMWVPVYLYGAWERGDGYLRRVANSGSQS